MGYRVATYRPTLHDALGGDPTAAEERLLAAAKAGGGAVYGKTRPAAASAENTLRAGLIRFLLLGGDAENPVSPRGVRAQGAWIKGPLDFAGCETQLDLLLQNCHFAAAPTFRDAQLGALFLPGCAVPGINLHRLRTDGNVHLREGFRSEGTVDLGGARIGGQLACDGGSFDGIAARGADRSERIGAALNGAALTVGSSVFLRDGFVARGEVNLVGATITGQLACVRGSFDGITARGADGLEQIGPALDGNALTVGADVFLSDGFAARGEVRLARATITGQLACVRGSFDGIARRGADGSEQVGPALDGNALTVGADVLLSDGFTARGEVNLRGATITGQLSCNGGSFEGTITPDADGSAQIGLALDGDALTVGADVLLGDGFAARGEVRLVGARITGQLACVRGSFDGIARRGADGSEQIGAALTGDALTVGAGFFWRGITRLRGGVDLTEAKVGVLDDDAASWAEARPLRISGFRYQALQSQMGIRDRLGWLAGKHEDHIEPAGFGARLRPEGCADFDPRPYTQLARVLARDGQRGNAALVLQEREHRLRAAEQRRAIAQMRNGWIVRPCTGIAVRWGLNLGFGLLFGYGHAPIRAIYWTVVSVAASTWFFGAVYDRGQFAPNSAVVLTSADWRAALAGGCPPAGDPGFATRQAAGCVMPLQLWTGGDGSAMPTAADYETFQPWLYAFDLFVPLIELGQTAAWAPSKARGVWGRVAFYARMPLQTLGWILAVVGAAVLTGLVGRREE